MSRDEGAVSESLAIPEWLRAEVLERDASHCRLCGRFDENYAIHHVRFGGDYRGIGGRRQHSLDNVITVGWGPGHTCHEKIHSNKDFWLPLSEIVAIRPGVTMLQLARWARAAEQRGETRG